jgi:formate dehydrogenase iron-sulfur subunit
MDRLAAGKQTACATVCPTGATLFGERDDLIRIARARIAADPSRYVDHIYGLNEAGGTSVLLLSGVPFGQLGLPTHLPDEPLPGYTWQALSKVPDVVLIAAVFLYGIHWITKRREYVLRMEGPEAVPRAEPSGAGGPEDETRGGGT